jgi:hypothetical protein
MTGKLYTDYGHLEFSQLVQLMLLCDPVTVPDKGAAQSLRVFQAEVRAAFERIETDVDGGVASVQ